MNFKNHSRINSITAGLLAAVILALPLAGCGQTAAIQETSSQSESSLVQSSSAASQINSQENKTSPSQPNPKDADSSAVSKTEVSSSAAQNLKKAEVIPQTSAKTKATGQTLKKISADAMAENGTQFSISKSLATAVKPSYTYVDQRDGYNFLPDLVSRAVYKQIFQSAYKVSATPNSNGYYPTQKITVSGTRLSEAQLRVILIAFLNDNPQIFWLANAYSYAYYNDSTYIQLYAVATQAQCTAMIQKLNQKVSAAISAMPSGLSEFDRELYLFHYIAQNCTYNNAAVTDTSIWQSFSAYGMLVDGTAVCEGYARAMQLLSSYSGLQCMLLSGQSSGENHMWNVIKIDGNWYHLDTTWGDSDTEVYNYFNLTDAVIAQTRTIFPSASTLTEDQIDGTTNGVAAECNLTVPSCTSAAANYFKVKGIKVSGSSDDSAIMAAFAAAIQSKSTSVSFYVDESADFDTVLTGMTTGTPYQILTCVSAVNSKQGTGSKIDLNNLKYLSDKADRGITVFLSYK